jgi:hypothetical protein
MVRLLNRWTLIAPWAIFLAMVLGWTAYWFSLSGAINRQLEAARADLGGYGRLSFASLETNGYPFRLIAHLRDARLDGPDNAYRLSTPRAQVAVNVLNPNHILVFADSPIQWRGLDLDWTISAERAEASLRLQPAGLGESRFALTNATISAPNARPTTITAAAIALRRDPADAYARQIAVTLDGFAPAPTRGFEGFAGAPLQLMAGLVMERAAAVTPGGDPLGGWAQSGARLRVERFQARRPGLTIAAEGAFTLDVGRRPTGAVRLTFEDAAAGVAAITASDTIASSARPNADALVTGQGLAGGAAALTLSATGGRWLFSAGAGAVDLGEAAPLYPKSTVDR